jgi:hypothetical protein
MSSVRTGEIARWKGTLMRYLAQLFVLLSTVLTTAAFAQSGNAPVIRQRVVTLADRTQIHILEAGVPTSAPALVFIPGWTMPAFLGFIAWRERGQAADPNPSSITFCTTSVSKT